MYHGPEGLKTIARRVNGLASLLAEGSRKLGLKVSGAHFFDTVAIKVRDSCICIAVCTFCLRKG